MPAHLALGFAPTEVAAPEVLQVRRVDRPIVTLAVGAPAGLDEAVVQREIVSDGITPARPAGTEIRIMFQDVLIDVGQYELLLRRRQYRHGDQADVAVLGFRLLRYPLVMRM